MASVSRYGASVSLFNSSLKINANSNSDSDYNSDSDSGISWGALFESVSEAAGSPLAVGMPMTAQRGAGARDLSDSYRTRAEDTGLSAGLTDSAYAVPLLFPFSGYRPVGSDLDFLIAARLWGDEVVGEGWRRPAGPPGSCEVPRRLPARSWDVRPVWFQPGDAGVPAHL